MKNFAFVITLMLASFQMFAQQGIISGTVKDKTTGEDVIGANVYIEGTTIGTATDVMGNFQFSVDPGTYNVIASFIGYANFKVTDLTVNPGEQVSLTIQMESDDVQLEEVVVTAKADKTAETILLLERKDASLLVQNIGAQELTKVGASDAGEGLTRVAGLSVQGSKFVVVRGLGDRYNSSLLNGFPIASPNPDKRVIPYDIFPSNVIQSLQVVKSFSPDLYADFSGASIRVNTLDYPEEEILRVSVGAGLNTQATGKDFLFDPFKSGDVLGYNRDRELPTQIRNYDGRYSTADLRSSDGLTEENTFDDGFSVVKDQAPINKSFGLQYGNYIQGAKANSGFGYLINANFSDSHEIRNGFLRRVRSDGSTKTDFTFDQYTYETSKAVLGNFQYKLNENNKVTLNTLYTHISENNVLDTEGDFVDFPGQTSFNRRITYRSYELFTSQLSGEHKINNKLAFDWGASFSQANFGEPDRRQLVYVGDGTTYNYNVEDVIENHRFFLDMQDTDVAGKAQLKYALGLNEEDLDNPFSSVTAGIQFRNKERDFGNMRYAYTLNPIESANSSVDIDNPDQYLGFDKLVQGDYDVREETQPSDDYSASLNIIAPYAIYSFSPIRNKLSFNVGLRYEIAEQKINYNLQTDSDFEPVRTEVLDDNEFFPSVVGRYNLTDDQIIRVSYSRTISRPDFRELAPFQYAPSFQDFTQQGNPELQNAFNQNLDLRYEYFFGQGDLFSVSAFGKQLDSPIVPFVLTGAVSILTYTNALDGYVYGAEFEMRKNLDFMGGVFKHLTLGSNVTILDSEVTLDASTVGTANSVTRPLTGASNYLVNADLTYNTETDNFSGNFTLAYNIFGRRLRQIGDQGVGDIYEMPVNTLNFTSQMRFGMAQRFGLSFSVKNILNPDVIVEQELPQATMQELDIDSYKRGVRFNLGVSFDLIKGN